MWDWDLGQVDLAIYTYGAGGLVQMVFEALRRIFVDGGFYLGLGLVAMVSFVGIFASAAFRAQRFNFQFFFVLIIVFYVLLLPKVDIHVEDRLSPANTGLVQNVPFAIAGPAAFFSTASKWLTETFETHFSLPGDMSYSANGALMANSLLEAQTQIEIPDQRLAQNFSEFWKSCVFYDVLLGLYSWNELTTTENLNTFISANTSNNRFFNYTMPGSNRNGDGGALILACRTGFNDYLKVDLMPHVQAICSGQAKRMLGRMMVRTSQAWSSISSLWSSAPQDPPEVHEDMNCINTMGDEALSKYAAAMPAALTFYTGVQSNATNITNQMMLANSMKRGLQSFASSADAPAAAQEFALARAQLERNNTFAVMGKIAAKFLPILKNIFECLIYAIAPVVMFMMFSPAAGKVALGYVKALVWINLWAPLYAILHFVMTYYTQADASSEFYQSGVNALSMQGYTKLGSIMSEHALLAGYLALSIPMIAWMLISMSGAMMSGLAGRVMQSYDSSVQRASTEAMTGNINMGNMSYGNARVMQENLAPTSDSGQASWYDAKTGMQRSLDTAGHHHSEQQQSSYVSQVDVASSVSRIAEDNLAKASSRVETTQATFNEAQSGMRTELESFMNKRLRSDSVGEMDTVGDASQFAKSVTAYNSELESFANSQGWAQEKRDAFMKEFGFSTQGTLGVGGGGSSLSATLSEGQKEMQGNSRSAFEGDSAVQQWANGEQFQKLKSNAISALNTEFGMNSSGTGEEAGSGLSGALSNLKEASKSHSQSVRDEETAQFVKSQATSMAGNIRNNFDDELNKFALEEYKLSQGQLNSLRESAMHGDGSERAEAQTRLEYIQQDFIADKMGLSSFHASPSDMGRGAAPTIQEVGRDAADSLWQDGRNEAAGYGGAAKAEAKARGEHLYSEQRIAEEQDKIKEESYKHRQAPDQGESSLPATPVDDANARQIEQNSQTSARTDVEAEIVPPSNTRGSNRRGRGPG